MDPKRTLLLAGPEGRVRRSILNLPAINPERLRMAKVQVEKAIKVKSSSNMFSTVSTLCDVYFSLDSIMNISYTLFASQMRKIFSIQGPYPVVRATLRARGWVERRLPRPNQHFLRGRTEEDDECNDGDESSDDDGDDDGKNDVHKIRQYKIKAKISLSDCTGMD